MTNTIASPDQLASSFTSEFAQTALKVSVTPMVEHMGRVGRFGRLDGTLAITRPLLPDLNDELTELITAQVDSLDKVLEPFPDDFYYDLRSLVTLPDFPDQSWGSHMIGGDDAEPRDSRVLAWQKMFGVLLKRMDYADIFKADPEIIEMLGLPPFPGGAGIRNVAPLPSRMFPDIEPIFVGLAYSGLDYSDDQLIIEATANAFQAEFFRRLNPGHFTHELDFS